MGALSALLVGNLMGLSHNVLKVFRTWFPYLTRIYHLICTTTASWLFCINLIVFQLLRFHIFNWFHCRSQWPRGLRRRSAAGRLLRFWVRIPPGAWIFVCCEYCVLSGRGLCDGLITHPEESYCLWCVVVYDLETSWMRRPWPALGRNATKKYWFHYNWMTNLKVCGRKSSWPNLRYYSGWLPQWLRKSSTVNHRTVCFSVQNS